MPAVDVLVISANGVVEEGGTVSCVGSEPVVVEFTAAVGAPEGICDASEGG